MTEGVDSVSYTTRSKMVFPVNYLIYNIYYLVSEAHNEEHTVQKAQNDKLSPQYAANLCTIILGYVDNIK